MRQRIPCTRRGRRCAPVRLNHLLNQRDVWCVLWEVRIGAEDCDERCPHHPARHVLVCRSIRLPLHGGGADPTTPWHVIAGATRSPSHGGAVLLIMEITFACIGGAAVRQRALAYATSVVVFGVAFPPTDGVAPMRVSRHMRSVGMSCGLIRDSPLDAVPRTTVPCARRGRTVGYIDVPVRASARVRTMWSVRPRPHSRTARTPTAEAHSASRR